jgi:hypothetical protein
LKTKTKTKRPMKNELQIQRAHDLFKTYITLAVRLAGPKILQVDDMPSIIASLDVLCWILDHDGGVDFANNMLELEANLFAKGIVLEDSGELHFGDQELKG